MVKIMVDSASDMTKELCLEKGMEFIPIAVQLGEKEYLDGVNLNRDYFYEFLTKSETFPQTSQPSPANFVDIFTACKERQEELIYLALSSSLSGTMQSAILAKNMVEYNGIYIVDSLAATFNIMVMADYAAGLAKEGMSAKEIVEKIEELKSHVKVIAGLDTLEYLAKGGRLSKAAASIGEMVRIKPVIELTPEGEVGVVGKCIGKNKAMVAICKQLEGKKLKTGFPVYLIYSYGEENAASLESRLNNIGILITDTLQIGTAIGTHIGPNAFGLIYVEDF